MPRKSTRSTVRPFEEVWSIVRRIPRKRVATFAQIAELLEARLSPLAVSWAIHKARIAKKEIPWQRVLGGDGRLTANEAYARQQRALLAREGIRVSKDGTVDLARYRWTPKFFTPQRIGKMR